MIDDLTNDFISLKQGNFGFESMLNDNANEAYDCYNRVNSTDPSEAFRWLPVYDGLVSANNPVISWEGICYDNI